MFGVLLLGLLLSPALPAQAQAPAPPVREQELFSMLRSRALFTDEQIVEVINARGIGFRLTDSVRKALKKDGAGAAVMDALEKAYERLKRRTAAQAAAEAKAAEGPPVAPPPPLAPDQQRKLLEEVRTNALEYTDRLPNFICTQVTKRFVQFGNGGWLTQDVILTRLAYNQKKETYQVVSINDQLTDRPYDSLSGATSTGEFGTLLHGIFLPETKTRFTWVGPAALRGRQVYEFEYFVEQEHSRWHLIWQKTDTVIPAYRGRVAVDAGTQQVLRLTVEAVDIPAGFPIRAAQTTLDYDYAKIAGRSFLLPLLAAVEMKEGQTSTRNEIQFRQYRRFTADTKLVFEEEPPK